MTRSIKFSLLGYLLLFILRPGSAGAATLCLGPNKAERSLIYLHGLEDRESASDAERNNRLVLEHLAQKLSMRIALPQSEQRCANGKRCWPASETAELRKTFELIKQKAASCWTGSSPKSYGLLGFSNGGYYAFKLYKAHQDPALKWIFASGSSGSWEPKVEKLNPLSRFYLMLGRKELTLPAAKRFAESFQKSDTRFEISSFDGGHHLHEATLLRVIKESGL